MFRGPWLGFSFGLLGAVECPLGAPRLNLLSRALEENPAKSMPSPEPSLLARRQRPPGCARR